MSLFSKPLMKWREPKIKGMVTAKNFLTILILILFVSIPFGFIDGLGNYKILYSLHALAFMSLASLGLLIPPLLPGTQICLTEDAIIRKTSRRRQKSPYRNIAGIYFFRNCTRKWQHDISTINVNDKTSKGPKFTSFEVRMKDDVIVDDEVQFFPATSRMVHRFTVPDGVDVEQVLQILRDKGVNVIEPKLTAPKEVS